MTITSIDFTILNTIQNILQCKFSDTFFSIITHFGDAGIFWIVTSLLLFIPKKTRFFGITLILSMAACYVTNDLIIKKIVCRLRPFQQNPMFQLIIANPHGSSFPSGHSAISSCVATLYFLFRKKLEFAKRFWIPVLVFAILIMISRMYLYVHFPSDVLCGALLGIIYGTAGYKIENKLRGNND